MAKPCTPSKGGEWSVCEEWWPCVSKENERLWGRGEVREVLSGMCRIPQVVGGIGVLLWIKSGGRQGEFGVEEWHDLSCMLKGSLGSLRELAVRGEEKQWGGDCSNPVIDEGACTEPRQVTIRANGWGGTQGVGFCWQCPWILEGTFSEVIERWRQVEAGGVTGGVGVVMV